MSNDNQKEGEVKIKRAKYGSLSLYEITEDELDALEQGSPESIYLNFSIFLISIAISFIIALVTTKIDSIKIFIFFIVVTVVSLLIGIALLTIWLKNHSFRSKIIMRIRDRMKPE